MVYKTGFVVAIKLDGKVLRESTKDTRFSTVYLPYHSQYSILLKNQKNVRALAKVEIDGMDALGGQELIINAHDSIDLERFILDGNMDSGNRFKFVPLSDSQVQDPNSPSNGDIVVTFTEEVSYAPYFTWTKTDWNWPRGDETVWYNSAGTSRGMSSGSMRSLSSKKQSSEVSVNYASIGAPMAAGDKGATVEGGRSGQRFVHGSFGDRGASYTIRVQLRAQKQAVYVSDTKHSFCQRCGKRNRFSANYCQRCGVRI